MLHAILNEQLYPFIVCVFIITIIRVRRLREEGHMSKSVHVCVFYDLELLRYGLSSAIKQQL